uniref:Uncharacterized protein n=1 Tax=Aegilops tauschii subsp. strangulata TaxID=200361 RepID=A0A453GHK2_AEGTS
MLTRFESIPMQIIELLSIRPPPVDIKMKLLKEIAEEHEIDWDPSETETEYLKPHEDLLNGPTYFSGSTLPLPKEKHEEPVAATAADEPGEDYQSDGGFDSLDLPEVPKAAIRPASGTQSTPDIGPHVQSSQSAAHDFPNPPDLEENPTADAALYNYLKSSEPPVSPQFAQPRMPALPDEKKQFVPFVSPPPFASASSMERSDSIPLNSPQVKPTEQEFFTRSVDEVTAPQTPKDFNMFSKRPEQVHSISPIESGENIDMDGVVSAAQTAADSAERAASAARAAANLAKLCIADLKKNTRVYESHSDGSQKESHHQTEQKPVFDHQDSFSNDFEGYAPSHVPQRSTSLEDDPFSYPNLFSAKP